MDLFYILFNVHFDVCIIEDVHAGLTFMHNTKRCFKCIGLLIEHCFVQHSI